MDFGLKEDGTVNPLIVAKWANNSPLVMATSHISQLKTFKAVASDGGDKDDDRDEDPPPRSRRPARPRPRAPGRSTPRPCRRNRIRSGHALAIRAAFRSSRPCRNDTIVRVPSTTSTNRMVANTYGWAVDRRVSGAQAQHRLDGDPGGGA